jgi:hypothetical protein
MTRRQTIGWVGLVVMAVALQVADAPAAAVASPAESPGRGQAPQEPD